MRQPNGDYHAYNADGTLWYCVKAIEFKHWGEQAARIRKDLAEGNELARIRRQQELDDADILQQAKEQGIQSRLVHDPKPMRDLK